MWFSFFFQDIRFIFRSIWDNINYCLCFGHGSHLCYNAVGSIRNSWVFIDFTIDESLIQIIKIELNSHVPNFSHVMKQIHQFYLKQSFMVLVRLFYCCLYVSLARCDQSFFIVFVQLNIFICFFVYFIACNLIITRDLPMRSMKSIIRSSSLIGICFLERCSECFA